MSKFSNPSLTDLILSLYLLVRILGKFWISQWKHYWWKEMALNLKCFEYSALTSSFIVVCVRWRATRGHVESVNYVRVVVPRTLIYVTPATPRDALPSYFHARSSATLDPRPSGSRSISISISQNHDIVGWQVLLENPLKHFILLSQPYLIDVFLLDWNQLILLISKES